MAMHLNKLTTPDLEAWETGNGDFGEFAQKFFEDNIGERAIVTKLAEHIGISAKTAYDWLRRRGKVTIVTLVDLDDLLEKVA